MEVSSQGLGTNPLLCGRLSVSNRSLIVEEIFNKLITILQQHAPSQRQLPRRKQPVWRTSECFATCVARNGPSDCQELPEFFLVSLARSCCQNVRQTFRQGQSPTRPDCVRWPERQDPLEQWRQHFMSIGARSSLLPMPRFFDSPFTTSELRCALSRCVESAVCLDGLPLLPFQRDVPLVAERVGEVVQPCLGVGCHPILMETRKSLSPISNQITRQVLEHYIHARIAPFIN